MNFFKELVDVGRRATVDALQSGSIDHDSPFSPEVPDDLRESMPDLFDRFPIVFPWSQPEPIDPALHTVWIMDNTAFRTPQPGDERPDLADIVSSKRSQPSQVDEDGRISAVRGASGWEAEFVACYFIKNSGRDISRIVSSIAHEVQISDDDMAARKRIAERVQPFVDAVLPKRTVRISMDGKEQQTLGPSSHSGSSTAIHQLHFNPGTQAFQSSALNLPPPFGLPSTTIPAEERGWAIISAIDDTIKVTMTPSPQGILHSTFVAEPAQPVAGMPEAYAHMATALGAPPFFYLSASPYPLYPFLRRFRESYYPRGTIMLRDASWLNLGGLIASLTRDVRAYKLDRLRRIHAWFPRRAFVCVGDSTHADPECYADIARAFPGWVRAIFIRKVEGIADVDEAERNSDRRFEKAFEGLDRALWHVLSDPAELAERVDALSAAEL